MENKKQFKLKILDSSTKESIIVTLDYSQLTSDRIRKAIPLCTKIITNGESQLLFVGDKNCKLELETLYNLASLIQSMLSDSMTWDIIDQIPPEEKQTEDLNGYLILNTDKQEGAID
ncbi:hypothetical protein GGR21_000017 [Dysgonomonas hofstadii]|uniref:Uncharacterized protein n=1 Tax=Dysgonomonas hofstadii TaxID=637886 RepID=A0A840CNH4_9BACT|nr:hypothetical protein [Dysgonomonas hofstadii]MBB4034132.1 hypothetical protein [Dysgonomonas hofstadii]